MENSLQSWPPFETQLTTVLEELRAQMHADTVPDYELVEEAYRLLSTISPNSAWEIVQEAFDPPMQRAFARWQEKLIQRFTVPSSSSD